MKKRLGFTIWISRELLECLKSVTLFVGVEDRGVKKKKENKTEQFCHTIGPLADTFSRTPDILLRDESIGGLPPSSSPSRNNKQTNNQTKLQTFYHF